MNGLSSLFAVLAAWALGSKALDLVDKRLDTGKKSSVDKSAVLSAVDNNQVLLDALVRKLATPDGAKALQRVNQALVKEKASGPIATTLRDAYAGFVKALVQVPRSAERGGAFTSVVEALGALQKDHALIRSHYAQLLEQPGAEIPLEQLKVAQMVVFGYIGATNLLLQWFSYIIYLTDLPADTRAPGYLVAYVKDSAGPAAEVINMLASRGHNGTVLTEVERIRRDGADVYLTTNGATLAQYASPDDYTPSARAAMQGFFRDPRLWLGDAILTIQHLRYQRNKAMKEWLEAKIALINLQQAGADPDSERYRQLEQQLAYYTQVIADYDKKVKDYEG